MKTSLLTRAMRRRWQLAAITIASGVAVATLLRPDWGLHDYEAAAVPHSPAAASAATGPDAPLVDPFVLKPAAIAALAASRQTAARAAVELGVDGDPAQLLRRLDAT